MLFWMTDKNMLAILNEWVKHDICSFMELIPLASAAPDTGTRLNVSRGWGLGECSALVFRRFWKYLHYLIWKRLLMTYMTYTYCLRLGRNIWIYQKETNLVSFPETIVSGFMGRIRKVRAGTTSQKLNTPKHNSQPKGEKWEKILITRPGARLSACNQGSMGVQRVLFFFSQ